MQIKSEMRKRVSFSEINNQHAEMESFHAHFGMQREHSETLLTFISYHLSLRFLFCLFLSGSFTQVLL